MGCFRRDERWSPLQVRAAGGRRSSSALSICSVGAIAWLGFSPTASLAAEIAPSEAGETAAESSQALKKLSLAELMNLEVTMVSRRPTRLSQAASALQVITGEEIRRSGASSIPEALRLADNLEVAQKNSHDWAISARGFNTALANKLLVLMDGRTVYTPLFSGVFWDVQDYLLEDLDRIEVVSGPGGSLWGANAVNGVISITSKPAEETQGLFLEGGSGTAFRGFSGVRYGGEISPKAHYRVYGKYFDRDNEATANGSSVTDSWSMGRGGFRVDAETSQRDNLTLHGDFYGGQEDLVTGGEAKVNGANLVGLWSRVVSPMSELRLQAYIDRTHLTDPIPALVINSIPFSPAGVLKDDLDTYDLDFQHHLQMGDRRSLVWGLGYRRTQDSVGNAQGLSFFPPRLSQNLASAFVQGEVALRQDLVFTIGTKVEHNDYTGIEIEPNVRLQWSVAPEHSLWAAISRAVRTPSRLDRDLSQPAPPSLVLLSGGSDFRSETVIAYELGYRGRIGSRIAAAISAFYNDYRDVRSTSTTSLTILPFFFENNVEGPTSGIELSGTFELADWCRLHAGYDLFEEDLRVKRGRTDFNQALNETADPQQQLSLRSSIDLPNRVELDAALRWVDSIHINNGPVLGEVPSYFELDLRLGWQATSRLGFSLVGRNLLHDRHPEYGFPGPARVEIARSAFGKVTWRF